jgi:putative Mg2+ transporter-C (MgtC) family protein
MIDDYLAISLHLGTALLAGALIGLERTFHGRPAGFRTHALVALASSLLMLLTLYQDHWVIAWRRRRSAWTQPAWRRAS